MVRQFPVAFALTPMAARIASLTGGETRIPQHHRPQANR